MYQRVSNRALLELIHDIFILDTIEIISCSASGFDREEPSSSLHGQLRVGRDVPDAVVQLGDLGGEVVAHDDCGNGELGEDRRHREEEVAALLGVAQMLNELSWPEEALREAHNALSLCEARDDEVGQAAALLAISGLQLASSPANALHSASEAETLYERLGDTAGRATALLQAASTANPTRAAPAASESTLRPLQLPRPAADAPSAFGASTASSAWLEVSPSSSITKSWLELPCTPFPA